MTIEAIRRKMKNNLTVDNKRGINISLGKFSFLFLVFSILSFCLVHLVVSSLLDPRGKELRILESQKDQLVEENRVLQQEIAKLGSLSVVVGRAEKDLGMKKANDVIYISTPSVSANIDTTIE
jgi:cell division protein FtsB